MFELCNEEAEPISHACTLTRSPTPTSFSYSTLYRPGLKASNTCLNIQAILSQAIIKAVSMTWLKRCWLFMPSAKKALRKSRTLFILSSPRCHAPFTWRPHQLRREYKYTVQCRKKSIILIFLSSLCIHKNRCRIYHITFASWTEVKVSLSLTLRAVTEMDVRLGLWIYVTWYL